MSFVKCKIIFWKRECLQLERFFYTSHLCQIFIFIKYLRQTLQCFSSEPSPHPSRPLQVIASERHLPLSHLNGQNLAAIRPRFRILQAPLGSSLPSLQDTTALQNSYAGKHWPLLHLNEPSGHSANMDRGISHVNSSGRHAWNVWNVHSFRKGVR